MFVGMHKWLAANFVVWTCMVWKKPFMLFHMLTLKVYAIYCTSQIEFVTINIYINV